MSNDDTDAGGFDLTSAVQSGVNAVRETFSFLGIEREAHVCEDCQAACEPAHAYDPARAAFDGGESPTWYCKSCDTHYIREKSAEDLHTADLYER